MVQHQPLDRVFSALSDATRRAMLASLTTGPKTIGALAAPHDMSFAGASKHVRVLESAGLVRRERHGREHVCHLRAEPLSRARQFLNAYAAFWDDRMQALEDLLHTGADLEPPPTPETPS